MHSTSPAYPQMSGMAVLPVRYVGLTGLSSLALCIPILPLLLLHAVNNCFLIPAIIIRFRQMIPSYESSMSPLLLSGFTGVPPSALLAMMMMTQSSHWITQCLHPITLVSILLLSLVLVILTLTSPLFHTHLYKVPPPHHTISTLVSFRPHHIITSAARSQYHQKTPCHPLPEIITLTIISASITATQPTELTYL